MAIDELPLFMESIGKIESGGNYSAVGVPTKYGRALGKYQIMERNWPNWARAAGIPGANWRDPKAQDHVARHMMSYYYAKYGTWDAVAVAWFAGEGSANRYVRGDRGVAGRKDALGTSVARYVEKTMLTMAQLAGRAGTKIAHGGGGEADFERIRQQQEEQRIREEKAAQEARNRDALLGNRMQEEVTELSGVSPGASMGDVSVGMGGPTTFGQQAGLLSGEQAVNALLTFQSEMMSLSTGDVSQPSAISQGVEADMAQKEQRQLQAEEEANLARGRELKEGLDEDLMAPRGQAAGGVSGNMFQPKGNWERHQVNAWAGQVASRFGVRANDSYRSPSHNKRVGGAKNSDHLWGGAVDFFGPKANMDRLAAWARQHQGAGKPFRVVIWQAPGHYDHVHISFQRNSNTPAPIG